MNESEARNEYVALAGQIANVAIAAAVGRHSYLPPKGASFQDVKDFEVHDWVINAIVLAFMTGAAKATHDPTQWSATYAEVVELSYIISSGVNVRP